MKKKILSTLLVLLLTILTTACVLADAAFDYYPNDSAANYDIMVSASDGGCNFRYGQGVENDKIISLMITNGTVLHVNREAQANNGNYWAYVQYSGYWGWVALSQCTSYSAPSGGQSSGGSSGANTNTPEHACYDVKVSAPDGGLNLRYDAGVDYARLMDYMIPNGTVLHIHFRKMAANGNYWGFTEYQGMWGWVALTQATDIGFSGDRNNVYADYDIKVAAPDGGVNFRSGPGTEYNTLINSMISNGTVLHVTSESVAANGNFWGYTQYGSQYGYVTLNQVEPIAALSGSSTTSSSNKAVGHQEHHISSTHTAHAGMSTSLLGTFLILFAGVAVVAGMAAYLLFRKK